MSRLSRGDLGTPFGDLVTQQDYSPRPKIDGVRFVDLRLMTDDGGSFTELVRCDEQGNLIAVPEFKLRQANFAEVQPGVIKAFHLHFDQEDVWFVPPSERLLVGLMDCREASPTYRISMRFVLGGGKTQLLYIPRGVAHGLANLYARPMTMVYFVNQHFRADDTDEHRLPWDLAGSDFWDLQRG